MSQPATGLVTESELPEYVVQYLGIRYEKESFLKPTKEFVTEFYGKFLDKTIPDWRKGQNTILLSRMVNLLRHILSEFDIEFKFNRGDIISPTRKRTTVFLNVLLYCLAQVDRRAKILQDLEAECDVQQQEIQIIHQDIIKKRDIRDRLAYELGREKTIDEIVAETQSKEQAFNDEKQHCDSLEKEKCSIKDEIEEQKKIISEIEETMAAVDLKLELDQLTIKESSLQEAILKEQIRARTSSADAELVLEKKKKEVQNLKNEILQITNDFQAKKQDLVHERMKIFTDREALSRQMKERRRFIKELEEKAAARLEVLKVPLADTTEIDSFMASYNKKIQSLFD